MSQQEELRKIVAELRESDEDRPDTQNWADRLESIAKAAQGEEPVGCPNCNNQGWYAEANRHTGEPEQVQCEFCYTTPNSRFNYSQKRATPPSPSAQVLVEALEEYIAIFGENTGSAEIAQRALAKYRSKQ